MGGCETPSVGVTRIENNDAWQVGATVSNGMLVFHTKLGTSTNFHSKALHSTGPRDACLARKGTNFCDQSGRTPRTMSSFLLVV